MNDPAKISIKEECYTINKFEDGKTEPFETVTIKYIDGEEVSKNVIRHYESESIPEESRAP